MSFRKCNHCLLDDMKAIAEGDECRVVVVKSKSDLPRFDEIFTHGMDVHVVLPDQEPSDYTWVCWFAEIPDHCVC